MGAVAERIQLCHPRAGDVLSDLNAGSQNGIAIEIPIGISLTEGVKSVLDWGSCSAVERRPGTFGGVLIFTGTRVPVYILFEHLRGGRTIEEFLDWFLGVARWQVDAVLDHLASALREDRNQSP